MIIIIIIILGLIMMFTADPPTFFTMKISPSKARPNPDEGTTRDSRCAPDQHRQCPQPETHP